MTEHAAVIFVFFFLAEYASIVLICILTTILFLGGYLMSISTLLEIIKYLDVYSYITILKTTHDILNYSIWIEGFIYAIILGLKTCIMIFTFILARASFPRIRFDQLMSFCWTVLLPIVIAFIILIPCIVYSFNIIPCNIYLL